MVNAEKLEKLVQDATEDEMAAISDKVRMIALQMLSTGQLDSAALKQVISAVVKGAQKGASRRSEQGTQALQQAMQGLDAALAAAAEATQLAIQEAAGRSNEFSRQGLKQTLDDLAALESLFIETLAEAAKSTVGAAQSGMRELMGHFSASGTAVGSQVKTALVQLGSAVADTTREQVEAGADIVRKEGALLAGLAAGILKGIAERLQSTPPSSRRDT
ncbi:hypothetical protein FY034_16050 [Trichlorobacter lovleyi]|uniref:DUF6781 family protein n=1 Tax=Trichlorobacter lovleyi TaxID=313985 RepID=UPI0022403271|nr:DUF6781 family protein [Trichlorobacter lovleyi]QOX80384.1 hypothetical protein FY034_16050 [Trichlorobacter lovleyi]